MLDRQTNTMIQLLDSLINNFRMSRGKADGLRADGLTAIKERLLQGEDLRRIILEEIDPEEVRVFAALQCYRRTGISWALEMDQITQELEKKGKLLEISFIDRPHCDDRK